MYAETAPSALRCTARRRAIAASAAAAAIALLGSAAAAPLTLPEALREARAQNARLPIPELDVALAREEVARARARRWLEVAVSGDFIYSPANSYDPVETNLGESRLQLAARQPLTAGGALRAGAAQAQARLAGARARYRMAVKDLDLEVRSRFAALLEAESEVRARQEGLDRLDSYVTLLESRRAAGQPVEADLLASRVRRAAAQADLEDARARAVSSRQQLDDLLGRDPEAPLSLAPLPPPSPPETAPASPWLASPEVAEAQANERALRANVSLIESERKPHLDLAADAGFWGSDTAHPGSSLSGRFDRDRGYSVGLFLAWPVWDAGGFAARRAQGRLAVEQAARQTEAARREARLAWDEARAARDSAYRQYAVLSAAQPEARDSCLEAQARYRGGVATSLEVLDAFAREVDASVASAQAQLRYHVAEALEIRWGTP